MSARRSKKRRNNPPDAEAASELPATPTYNKPWRVSTHYSEAGVNHVMPSAARILLSRPRQAAGQIIEAEEVVRHEDCDEGKDTELHAEEIEVIKEMQRLLVKLVLLQTLQKLRRS